MQATNMRHLVSVRAEILKMSKAAVTEAEYYGDDQRCKRENGSRGCEACAAAKKKRRSLRKTVAGRHF